MTRPDPDRTYTPDIERLERDRLLAELDLAEPSESHWSRRGYRWRGDDPAEK